MGRRDEEKKRRRAKRLEKKRSRPAPVEEGPIADLEATLRMVYRQLSFPPVTSFPGGCDPSVAFPDRVKYEMATWATERSPGASRSRQLEYDMAKGPLGEIPNIDHWAIEEFLWHGLPGDDWNPVEAYLAHAADKFPAPARAQLEQWKQARFGLWEIGEVKNDQVALRDWDAYESVAIGPWVHAITLNIGGANVYGKSRGKILATYLAPWVPERSLYCGMGYGSELRPNDLGMWALLLALRDPEVAARPLPWKVDRGAAQQWLHEWRQREWHGWFREHLHFPILGMVMTPKGPRVGRVVDLAPSTPEEARHFGLYFAVTVHPDNTTIAGGTAVRPLEFTSPGCRGLLEYHAYRAEVGPPPGAASAPSYFKFTS